MSYMYLFWVASVFRVAMVFCVSGIDYTLSNKIQGKMTYGGFSLHDVCQPKANPYQQVSKHLTCLYQ